MPLIYTLNNAPLHVLLHLFAALSAIVMGAAVLFREKGTYAHRIIGRIWVVLMFVVAIGSFFIQARSHLSWIHLLSAVVIVNLSFAIHAIRNNNVRRHRYNMRIAYASLCIAGVFTLLPYRMLGKLVFG